ncbi:MAG TPA: hypothetical protein VF812_12105 [Ktedonobacterales bacterium]
MLTGAPPSDVASATPSPRRRVWPWAAGSILITLAVIVATLVGHRLAAQARLAAEVAPAPTLPPIAVSAIIRAPGRVTHLALDPRAHTLVAEAQNTSCPPPTPEHPQCDSTGTPGQGVAFYDSVTGALRSQHLTPISTAGGALFTVIDTTHSVTYTIASGMVTTYADATGKQTGEFALRPGMDVQSAAVDGPSGMLYLLDSANHINPFVGDLPAATMDVSAPPNAQLLVDASAQRVYAYAPGKLQAFNASDLAPLGSWRVPQGLRAGPLDAATHTLYLFSSTGQQVWRLDLAGLPASGTGQTVTPQEDTALRGVTALGFDGASSVTALIDTSDGETLAGADGKPYARAPLVQASSAFPADNATQPLPVDTSAGLTYLLGDDNTILIASVARPTSYAAPNALTAALIARAGMARLLPDTNQVPPFVSAQMFPLGAGSVARNFFIHYSDLGWKGPYAGTASITDVRAGAQPGDYTMTFTLSWNQLFIRQHSWTVEVTPDGRTHLRADTGDGLP